MPWGVLGPPLLCLCKVLDHRHQPQLLAPSLWETGTPESQHWDPSFVLALERCWQTRQAHGAWRHGVPGLQVWPWAVPQHGAPPALTFQDGHVDLRQGLVLGVGEALVRWVTAVDAAGLRGQPLLGTASLLLPRGPGEGRKQAQQGATGGGQGPLRCQGCPIPCCEMPRPWSPLTWQRGAGTVPLRGPSANAGRGWGWSGSPQLRAAAGRRAAGHCAPKALPCCSSALRDARDG